MKQSDVDRIKRFNKAFPELKAVYTDEQIIKHLNDAKKEKRIIDKYIEGAK